MKLNELTIEDSLQGLKEKKFSCAELVEDSLSSIKETEPKLNAYITVDEQGALEQAKKVDEMISVSGNKIFGEKPLLGIPIALKDIFSTKNLKTTAGSKIIDNYVPPYDATTVSKLIEAGCVIIGKTNLDAWAHGASGENSEYGPTHNPYDLEKVPGGSSSGSAASVAARNLPVAMGTDTGGSIRQPASFCNLVGLKPTYGRVSRYGIIAMASSFDSIGHFTRTVTDNAKVLQVTAGKDPYDATTLPAKVPDYSNYLGKSIKGMNIGLPKEYMVEGIDPEVKKIVDRTVEVLEKLGANIKTISLPHTEYAMACYYILVPSEVSSNLGRYNGIRFGRSRDVFGDEAKRRIMLGTYTLSAGYYDAYYLKAEKVRTLIRRDFEEAFKKVNIIMAPVSPTLPFKIGEKSDDPLQMYLSDIFTSQVNIVGLPGLAVPAGFVGDLPVGIQFIGPHLSEEILYQAGYAFEQQTKYYEVAPKLE